MGSDQTQGPWCSGVLVPNLKQFGVSGGGVHIHPASSCTTSATTPFSILKVSPPLLGGFWGATMFPQELLKTVQDQAFWCVWEFRCQHIWGSMIWSLFSGFFAGDAGEGGSGGDNRETSSKLKAERSLPDLACGDLPSTFPSLPFAPHWSQASSTTQPDCPQGMSLIVGREVCALGLVTC